MDRGSPGSALGHSLRLLSIRVCMFMCICDIYNSCNIVCIYIYVDSAVSCINWVCSSGRLSYGSPFEL